MTFQFGNGVLNLPASVLAHSDVEAEPLRVLLWLASDPSLAETPDRLAKLASCTKKLAKQAVEYWISCGVLCREGESVPAMASVAPPKAPSRNWVQRADELPTYTYDELTVLLEKRAPARAMVTEAQQLLGKLFNASELNILIGMLDYLGMTEECILLLLAHCRNIGKTNLRAIEKMAYKMVDKGITDPVAMEEEIRTMETMHSFEGEVRKLFGMKSRALSGKEDNMLRAWLSFGYDIEIVRFAYEITVNATGNASLPYANSILVKWNADGLKTLSEIERAEEENRQKKAAGKGKAPAATPPGMLGNSFDTDDFFQAALDRSFAMAEDKKDD